MNENSDFTTAFEHDLSLSLELESDGKKAKVLSGHIEKFSIKEHPYGHSSIIQFSGINNKEMDALFRPEKVIKSTLTFKAIDPVTGTPVNSPQLELKGIVTSRCVKRVTSYLETEEKSHLIYEITVVDYAQATWGEHHPINVYVDKSMKKVFEAHVNPEITIKFDWDKLDDPHPIIAFSLPHKDWLPPDQQVSFYSFLNWYLHKENGILSYDYKAHSYALLTKKAKAGKPLNLLEWWVDPPICRFPNPARHNIKKMKPTFESIENEDKENKEPFKSVQRNSINAENYRCYPEQAYQETLSTLMPEKNVIEVELVHFDKTVKLDQLVPGSAICFKGKGPGTWSSDDCYKGKTFVVRSLFIQADKMETAEELIKPSQKYRMQIKAILEEDGEPFVLRPSFIPPQFPFTVLGAIFSDVGDKEQSTYNLLKTEKVQQGQYLVQVPHVEDNKKVVVPFTPDFISGQFYFPFTKGQKVEVAMYLHTAKIQRPADWQPLTRMDMSLQANQIVLASNGKDKYIWLRHEFEGGKDSVFTIEQATSDTQKQIIKIKDKDTLITVEEKDKKKLFIHMNNDVGLTLSLEDKNANMTQQTLFDGKAMTHICKSGDTSTIVQKPDSISFDSKKINLSCEELILDAKDSISMKGANKFDVESKIANIKAPSVKLG